MLQESISSVPEIQQNDLSDNRTAKVCQSNYICLRPPETQYVATPKIKTIEKISKALGDSNRLKILQYIAKKGGCGQCSEIQEIIDLAQPSISHHIKILLEAGLIEQEKNGRNHQYSLNQIVLSDYMGFVSQLKG